MNGVFVGAVSLCEVTTMPITFQCDNFTNKSDTETIVKCFEVYSQKSVALLGGKSLPNSAYDDVEKLLCI